jgi:hypothetical protein
VGGWGGAILGVLSVGFLIFLGDAYGISQRLSIEELAHRSDLVALLQILEVPETDTTQAVIDYRARIIEAVKGQAAGCSRLTIREGVGLSTAVEYSRGQTVVAFLSRREGCVFSTVGSVQGALVVENDHVRMSDGSTACVSSVIQRIRSGVSPANGR